MRLVGRFFPRPAISCRRSAALGWPYLRIIRSTPSTNRSCGWQPNLIAMRLMRRTSAGSRYRRANLRLGAPLAAAASVLWIIERANSCSESMRCRAMSGEGLRKFTLGHAQPASLCADLLSRDKPPYDFSTDAADTPAVDSRGVIRMTLGMRMNRKLDQRQRGLCGTPIRCRAAQVTRRSIP